MRRKAMKAKFRIPIIERDVEVTMTQSEAKIIREFLGRYSTNDYRDFIDRKGMTMNVYDLDNVTTLLYRVLGEIEEEEQ
jgi:hypothetical protein